MYISRQWYEKWSPQQQQQQQQQQEQHFPCLDLSATPQVTKVGAFSQFKNASDGFSSQNFPTTAEPVPAAILRFPPPFYAKKREIRAALAILDFRRKRAYILRIPEIKPRNFYGKLPSVATIAKLKTGKAATRVRERKRTLPKKMKIRNTVPVSQKWQEFLHNTCSSIRSLIGIYPFFSDRPSLSSSPPPPFSISFWHHSLSLYPPLFLLSKLQNSL